MRTALIIAKDAHAARTYMREQGLMAAACTLVHTKGQVLGCDAKNFSLHVQCGAELTHDQRDAIQYLIAARGFTPTHFTL